MTLIHALLLAFVCYCAGTAVTLFGMGMGGAAKEGDRQLGITDDDQHRRYYAEAIAKSGKPRTL